MQCHDCIIKLDNISFSYQSRKVIDELSFSVLQRDFVGLIGSNGAGKTTLLKLIVGQLKPDKGEIELFGVPISQYKDWDKIGYVPQKNNFNPLFPATVKEVVLSGLYGRKKMFHRIQKSDLQKCEDAMHVMGIEDLADLRVGQLSGGQQQRVFLARALINSPELLILDEPTVGIDAETQKDFFHMIQHMHMHHHMTFLMVSHDIEAMKSYLGEAPKKKVNQLNFYIKHSHEIENCDESNLSHTIADLRNKWDHQLLQIGS